MYTLDPMNIFADEYDQDILFPPIVGDNNKNERNT